MRIIDKCKRPLSRNDQVKISPHIDLDNNDGVVRQEWLIDSLFGKAQSMERENKACSLAIAEPGMLV